LEKQADYLLAVKENQPELHEEIDLFFQAVESQIFPFELKTCQTVDKEYGCIETKTYSITDQIDFLSCVKVWPGIQSIGSVTSERCSILRLKSSLTADKARLLQSRGAGLQANPRRSVYTISKSKCSKAQ
jgi:hypothetical protein